MSTAATPIQTLPPRPRGYVPAVGPRLKILLYVVFILFALLGANSLYLAGITFLTWLSTTRGQSNLYETPFSQSMFLLHSALGLLIIVPFVAFGAIHMVTARTRRNKRAIRVGYALFIAGIVVLVSGLALMRLFEGFDLRHPMTRSVVYWAHVGAPLAAVWLYWLHRLAGPKIHWRVGIGYLVVVGVVVGGMMAMHSHDPRKFNVAGSVEGVQYFEPSLARTADGNFIPEKVLTANDYCLQCHKDAYDGWFHSAHRFSSGNNPMYLASVTETREVSMKRDGNMKASRWCAGCHDPVPFFSGAFDDPNFDLGKHPAGLEGITCTTCHSIVHIGSSRGNADYTIEQPVHYPFAFSSNPALRAISNQLVKSKPAMHKATFLKPLHKSAEFCSTCHKVHLPKALNHYKEFLRGQNSYDSFLLSGVSGHGARSFYYPPKSQANCAGCHMPLQPSADFGARLFDDTGSLKIHDHLFVGANTGLAAVRGEPDIVKRHEEFLKSGIMRVDVFGLREGGEVNGKLAAPLRPEVPDLEAGKTYLLETVLRTLKVGHQFTQGTADSNEVWVDVTVTSDGKVIGRNGALDAKGGVDPWSHFVNVYMLDRHGNRIDRRNPQDIFTPLYNHQIGPGTAQVVHYELQLPEQLTAPVTVEVNLQYRKFDKTYMDYVTKKLGEKATSIAGYTPGTEYINTLPITTIASDSVTFPVKGVAKRPPPQESKVAEADRWQRWNDYGIGLLQEGVNPRKFMSFLGGVGNLRQAQGAFIELEKLGRFEGPVNLARAYLVEGQNDKAVEALKRAAEIKSPAAPTWTLAWLNGVANREQGNFEEALVNFRSVVDEVTPEMSSRGFDFSYDIVILDLLAQTLIERASQGDVTPEERQELLDEAIRRCQKVLKIDSEDVTAHFQLQKVYTELGKTDLAQEHRIAHARYKGDDNAADEAVNIARKKNAAANAAAESIVKYPLNRKGAPGLADVAKDQPTARADK